jgi:hypothetical protein
VVRALEGGQRLERAQLYEALEARRIRTAKSRGLHILLWLAMDGTICLAGREGKQHTFALLDEWIPTSRTYDRAGAFAELARRYFTSHGPATRRDFMWWAGITAKDAQEAIESVQPALSTARVDGDEYFWRAVSSRRLRRTAVARAQLLPAYDEYTVGYQDRSLLVAPPRRGPAVGLLGPVAVIDGLVVGSWRRKLSREQVAIEVRLSRRLARSEARALDSAAEAYGAFLGMNATLEHK